MVCTFFGHREATEAIAPQLHAVLVRLIEEEGVTQFYVGHQGAFDRIVAKELERLQATYPKILWEVVRAYFPNKKDESSNPAVYPAGMERVPPRYAINKRNEWMIHQADIVVTWTMTTHGGAAMWKEKAIKRGKRVLEIHD